MLFNHTGENPGWTTTDPSYGDFYTLWGIFRCLTPLYHLVQSPTYAEMLRSIIDILCVHSTSLLTLTIPLRILFLMLVSMTVYSG
jgi:putative alpha-1,2-mannosidase